MEIEINPNVSNEEQQHWFPSTLLAYLKSKNEPTVIKFLEAKNKTALDIGCEFPLYLWELHHLLGFSKIDGFDRISSEDAIKNTITRLCADEGFKSLIEQNKGEINSMFDIYCKAYVPLMLKQNYDFKIPLMNPTDYAFHFNFKYNKDWNKAKNSLQYDYLMLANVIHLNGNNAVDQEKYADEFGPFEPNPVTTSFFGKSEFALKRGGLLYVRVPHRERSEKLFPKAHIRFDRESLLYLIGPNFTQIYFDMEESASEGIKNNSMVYLGIKTY